MQDRNEQNKGRVLIVDDEFHSARAAASVLSQAGYECETFPTVEAALLALDFEGADVIVANMRMPGVDGMDLLKKVHDKEPDMTVVLTAPGQSAESAKAALKGGAFDESLARAAAEAALKDAQPMSDNAYKVVIAKVIVRRAIMAAAT